MKLNGLALNRMELTQKQMGRIKAGKGKNRCKYG